MISAETGKMISIGDLKRFVLDENIPEPARSLVLSTPDTVDAESLVVLFFQWRKILRMGDKP